MTIYVPVSVQDRLPEEGKAVSVYQNDKLIGIARWENGTAWLAFGVLSWEQPRDRSWIIYPNHLFDYTITHWLEAVELSEWLDEVGAPVMTKVDNILNILKSIK